MRWSAKSVMTSSEHGLCPVPAIRLATGLHSLPADVTSEKKNFAHMSPITYANKAIAWAIAYLSGNLVVCNLQFVILDKSRAYTRGNHNFQCIGFLIKIVPLKKLKILFAINIITSIFTPKYAYNLYEMCKSCKQMCLHIVLIKNW